MFKSYPIEIINSNELILYYPSELKFSDIQTITFGSLTVSCKAVPQKEHTKTITMTKSLANHLHIPDLPLRLHLFEKEGSLFIGPIVGIFTAGFTGFPGNPMGSRSYSLSKFFLTFEQVGVLPVVFGIQHIDWEQGFVTGYVYHKNKWKQIEVPLPNVIYDRLPNRAVENLQNIQSLKTRLQEEYAIPWFNPGFFNKLDIYNRLVNESAVNKYLPKTVPFEEKSLKDMLFEFGFLYVKPDHGSSGKGIYQIQTVDDEIFVRFRDNAGNNRLIKCANITKLCNFLQEHLTGPYIIQQGIKLFRVDQHIADFRIHTNKLPNGKWVVTTIGCKVAGTGSPTTHLLAGGQIKTIEEIFPDHEERKTKTKKLVEAALTLSKYIEKNINGIVAEIGFDFGVDKSGKVWMFEANAKPGRSIFNHPQLSKYERLSNKYLLLHAVKLMEQVITNPEKIFHEFVLQ
ncbi:YheC/YheD family protein [Caldifermentibacillus hisashii]|uniref:YheC/YheD family endospore coat-associated protein n=1 Tax=Caldifermentibacillus hisashii TaxID=996558 RepID=UPI0031FCBD0A